MAARRRRRMKDPKALAELLPKIYPAPDQLETAKVFGWWARAVPERVVRHARPVRLRRGTLYVHVTSSAWAQELSYLQEQLLRAIKKAVPGAGVKSLRFKVGPLPELPHRERAQPQSEPPAPVAVLPEDLARTLAGIRHDGLRDTIARAAAVSLAHRRKG